MLSLKQLLPTALKRARITTQVSAARVVSVADDALRDLLGAQKADARAVSYQGGILTVETRHSSASAYIHANERELLETVKRHVPDQPISRLRYRIVGRFRGSEIEAE